MPKYVSLFNWTEQGVKSYRDTVDRADAAKKLASNMGGSFELYWTLGDYDLVGSRSSPMTSRRPRSSWASRPRATCGRRR